MKVSMCSSWLICLVSHKYNPHIKSILMNSNRLHIQHFSLLPIRLISSELINEIIGHEPPPGKSRKCVHSHSRISCTHSRIQNQFPSWINGRHSVSISPWKIHGRYFPSRLVGCEYDMPLCTQTIHRQRKYVLFDSVRYFTKHCHEHKLENCVSKPE